MIRKPLYVKPDNFGIRYMVCDDSGNVLFITDLGDEEPKQTATIWAMKMGGWIYGAVSERNI